MIMGDKVRRCPCDVGPRTSRSAGPQEPENLARTIAAMKLSYVVITSVDRDDLRDSGAGHFVGASRISANCRRPPASVLVPDFRAAWTAR